MKKLRRVRHWVEPDDAPTAHIYRHHIARKEYQALGGVYAYAPKKLTKGERAAAKRLAQAVRARRPLEPRPPHDAPWWLELCAQVLAVGRCAWCGSTRRLIVDHIQPLSQGGTNGRRNLRCLCRRCDLAKGNLTGISACPG